MNFDEPTEVQATGGKTLLQTETKGVSAFSSNFRVREMSKTNIDLNSISIKL
jgi:hypothetical protein